MWTHTDFKKVAMGDSNRTVNAKWDKTIEPAVGMPYGKMKPGFITRMEENLSRVIFVAYSWPDKLC